MLLSAGVKYSVKIALKRLFVVVKSFYFCRWIRLEIDVAFARVIWWGRNDDFEKVSKYYNSIIFDSATLKIIEPCAVKVYGFPLPGTLKVPIYLDAIVDLSNGTDFLLSGLGENVRRLIRRSSSKYRIDLVGGRVDIELANKSLFVPYGNSRHGGFAVNLTVNSIEQLLLGRAKGKLHFLYNGDALVGCHLGYESIEPRGKVWNALRFGYSAEIFNDTKLLDEANTINSFLAMQWAYSNGFKYYNFGMSGGEISDGLLRWKMRRGGWADAARMVDFFYLKVKKGAEPAYYWDAPTFSLSGDRLCLCIGQPNGVDMRSLKARYKSIFSSGVGAVVLYRSKSILDEFGRNEFFEYIKINFPFATVCVKDF